MIEGSPGHLGAPPRGSASYHGEGEAGLVEFHPLEMNWSLSRTDEDGQTVLDKLPDFSVGVT